MRSFGQSCASKKHFAECPGLIPIESTRKDTPVVRRTVLGVRIEYSLWTSQTLRFCFVKENRIISATVFLLLLLLPISIQVFKFSIQAIKVFSVVLNQQKQIKKQDNANKSQFFLRRPIISVRLFWGIEREKERER